MRQPVTVPSAFPAESLVDSRLCRRKTPTHCGIYVPSVSALGRDETCSQRSAKYLERPGRSPRESVNGRELGLLFTVTPSRAVRDTETVRSITLKPASPTRGSLSACDDTNGHQLKMLQPQDTQNTVLPLISTRVTDSHACAKGGTLALVSYDEFTPENGVTLGFYTLCKRHVVNTGFPLGPAVPVAHCWRLACPGLGQEPTWPP